MSDTNVQNESETATEQTETSASRRVQNLDYWRGLESNQNPLPHMDVIPYGTKGSTFGCCGIRIEGHQEFIDSVMSNLQGLLDGETEATKLDVAIMDVKPREGMNAGQNAYPDAKVVYIRLKARGTGKRGRPKGSKNRPKVVAESVAIEPTNTPATPETVNA